MVRTSTSLEWINKEIRKRTKELLISKRGGISQVDFCTANGNQLEVANYQTLPCYKPLDFLRMIRVSDSITRIWVNNYRVLLNDIKLMMSLYIIDQCPIFIKHTSFEYIYRLYCNKHNLVSKLRPTRHQISKK